MKFKEYDDKTFMVKKLKADGYMKTEVPMVRRTLGNLPRYANGKPRVHFKDWMGIKGEKRNPSHSVTSFGKAESDGKWYGWSHRAIYGFGVGDKVPADASGNGSGKEYTIKTDDQAKQAAIAFADDVS